MAKIKAKNSEKFEIQWVQAVQEAAFWDKMVQEDSIPQNVLNVSEELLKDYYTASAELLNEKKWNEARDAFLFLTFLNPGYQNFWMGLGIAEQASGNLHAALVAYLLAEAIDSSNPSVHTNAYQCYIALENKKAAEWAHHKAMQAFGNKPEHAEMKSAFIKYCLDLEATRRPK